MSSSRSSRQANGINSALFFVALISGVAAIIALKITGAHQIVVTAVPVFIMLVYAGFIYIFRNLRLRLDQAGDNLYYLGFLYTLTSLAYSLIEFGSSNDAASSIISNFGVAIATTITGLALRVIFSQLRTDPVETEQLARVELADASRHLRTELDIAAREFSMFRRSLQQMMAETFQDLLGTIDETMLSGLSRFEDSIELFSGAVLDANKGFENRSEAVQKSSDKLVSNILSLANKIDSIQISEDVFVRKLQPAIVKIDETSQKLASTIVHFSERVNGIELSERAVLDKFQPAIEKITQAAEAAHSIAAADSARAEAWGELADIVPIVTDGINRSLKGVQNTVVVFESSASAVQSAAIQMSVLAERLEKIDSKLGSIADSTDKEIKRVVDNVLKNLDGLSHQLSSQANRLSELNPESTAQASKVELSNQMPLSTEATAPARATETARPTAPEKPSRPAAPTAPEKKSTPVKESWLRSLFRFRSSRSGD